MTTGYEAEVQVDLDALDGRFEDNSIAQVFSNRRYSARAEVAAVLSDVEDWSNHDPFAISTSLRRWVWTVTPFIISDMVALSLCGIVSQALFWICFPHAARVLGWHSTIALWPMILAYLMGGLYSEIWVHPVIELRQLTHLNTVGFLGAAAGCMLAPPYSAWLFLGWLISLPLVSFCRAMARRLCGGRAWWGYPTLVIGSGAGLEALARTLMEAPNSGLRPALLTDPEGTCRSSFMPVVNDSVELRSLLRRRCIRHAVVSLPDFSASRLTEMLDRYAGLLPHLLVMSDASTIPTLWGASRSCGRLSGIEVRNGLLLSTLQGAKRVFDVAMAVVGLTVGLPLLAIIALAVRLTSPGGAFFGHSRIGRNGQTFKAWKFRTMYKNASAILDEHLRNNPAAMEEWNCDQKLKDDPRVTPLGKLLRRSSLDELPQLWNVLRGDMSFVGPRPIVPDEIRRYADTFPLYRKVKPGITGLWQVSGRSNLDYQDRVLLDRFYIRHWSPWLDMYIFGKTFIALLSRSGAY